MKWTEDYSEKLIDTNRSLINMNFKALFYTALIDPLLKGLRRSVMENIDTSAKVIDIACGPGTLALEMSKKAGQITGIDLDEYLITFAASKAGKKGLLNLDFKVLDASDLSGYHNDEFDIAVTSMAVHQFPEELAVKILHEMKRISRKVIIADYNYPMPRSISRSLAYGIERIAKGEHHRNFRNFMSRGGISWFTGAVGLTIRSAATRGNGVFLIAVCY